MQVKESKLNTVSICIFNLSVIIICVFQSRCQGIRLGKDTKEKWFDEYINSDFFWCKGKKPNSYWLKQKGILLTSITAKIKATWVSDSAEFSNSNNIISAHLIFFYLLVLISWDCLFSGSFLLKITWGQQQRGDWVLFFWQPRKKGSNFLLMSAK